VLQQYALARPTVCGENCYFLQKKKKRKISKTRKKKGLATEGCGGVWGGRARRRGRPATRGRRRGRPAGRTTRRSTRGFNATAGNRTLDCPPRGGRPAGGRRGRSRGPRREGRPRTARWRGAARHLRRACGALHALARASLRVRKEYVQCTWPVCHEIFTTEAGVQRQGT
jgi:hypothetical protein